LGCYIEIGGCVVEQDGWRLKEELTCGAHMSMSGGREKRQWYFSPYRRCVYVQWSDSGPRHPKNVENSMDHVDEEL